ncbi:MAG: DUF3341 domain-containing protein, partial [Chloroflexi bacterium]
FRFGGMLVGILLAAFITIGTPALYPIRVGGQPLVPLPPSAIIFFELVALCTMLGVFFGFLMQNRFPILTRRMYDERITDGYIGVEVRAPGRLVDQVVDVFEGHHARVIQREDAAAFKPAGVRHLMFWGALGTGGLIAALVPLLLTYDIIKIPWINIMRDTVVVQHQEGPRRAAPEQSIPIQGPVLIAGEPATEPQPASELSLERGKILYGYNCAMCHGAAGDLQGAEVGKYFPEAASLVSENVQNLSDDEIFVVITLGKNRMPSLGENLDPGETWDIVHYVRSLSAAPAAQ